MYMHVTMNTGTTQARHEGCSHAMTVLSNQGNNIIMQVLQLSPFNTNTTPHALANMTRVCVCFSRHPVQQCPTQTLRSLTKHGVQASWLS